MALHSMAFPLRISYDFILKETLDGFCMGPNGEKNPRTSSPFAAKTHKRSGRRRTSSLKKCSRPALSAFGAAQLATHHN
jgi:hypothetical protein